MNILTGQRDGLVLSQADLQVIYKHDGQTDQSADGTSVISKSLESKRFILVTMEKSSWQYEIHSTLSSKFT